MKVSAMIEALTALPADAEVVMIWDGSARTVVESVFLTKGGFVALAEPGDVVYRDQDRPVDAPDEATARYWYVGD